MTKKECEIEIKKYKDIIGKTGYHRGNPKEPIWIKVLHMEIKQAEDDFYVLCNCRNEQGHLPYNLTSILQLYDFCK
jgi:hypothetical protein